MFNPLLAAGAARQGSWAGDATIELLTSFDWSRTGLGPIALWPESFKGAVRLIMASPVPMVILAGQDGNLIYNQGYAVFAGNRHPQIFGMPALEAWPEIADFNRHKMELVGQQGHTLVLKDQELVLNRRGSAESAWMDLTYSPLFDDTGSPNGLMAVVIETTERVLAQKALALSQERLDLALGTSGIVGIWDWDLTTDRVRSDQRFAQFFSIDLANAEAGVPIEQFLSAIHPGDRNRVGAEIARAIATGTKFSSQYRLQNPAGEVTWIVASGSVVRNEAGQGVRFPGIAVDVSEQMRAAEALVQSEQRFRVLADTMPQMVWSTRPDGYHDYYNARWYEFTGMAPGSTDGEGWAGVFHPQDQDRAWSRWRQCLATGEPYHIEYRLRHRSGDYRWVLGQALPMRDSDGAIVRWFGTCTDIHQSRLIAEEREIVAQELSHRIKNIFSVVTSIISMSARTHPEIKTLTDQLRQRIHALGRAHDFVRPHSKASQPSTNPASLFALLAELMRPYQPDGGQRIVCSGDDAVIDDGAATPLALLFHELATNAAKYGALSVPDGRVVVVGRQEGSDYHLRWTEEGVSDVGDGSFTDGFGSRLMSLSVEGQLRGTMQRRLEAGGLVVDLVLPVEALSRSSRLSSPMK